jgi:DNA-binding Xre family transcriptional regulator
MVLEKTKEESMVSYNKLWKLLIDKGINKKELIKLSGVSSSSIAKLTKGENVTTDVLCKICKALSCDFKDIMEYIMK